MVDKNGAAIILKNNKPKYVLVDCSQLEEVEDTKDSEVDEIAQKVLSKHIQAFEELAK